MVTYPQNINSGAASYANCPLGELIIKVSLSLFKLMFLMYYMMKYDDFPNMLE